VLASWSPALGTHRGGPATEATRRLDAARKRRARRRRYAAAFRVVGGVVLYQGPELPPELVEQVRQAPTWGGLQDRWPWMEQAHFHAIRWWVRTHDAKAS
jgi:hypothetical protein